MEFLYRKWTPTEIDSKTLIRLDLINKIESYIQNNLNIEIIAPTGFGKSVLLSQWAKNTSFNTLWFKIDQSDSSSYRFARNLCHAFSSQLSEHTTFQELILEDFFEKEPIYHIEMMLECLSNSHQKNVLIFDQLENNLSHEVLDLLSFFIFHCPKNTQIILAGTSLPANIHLNYPKENIFPEDLYLSKDEIKTLFKLNHISLKSEEARKLKVSTGGRATYLSWLASQNIISLPEIYIENDIESKNPILQEFENLSQYMQNGLINIVILNDLNQELLTWLLDYNFALDILNLLHKQKWIHPVQEQGHYQMISIIKSILLKRFYLEPYQTRNILLKKITYWYLKQQQYKEASHYAMQSSDKKWNLETINKYALELFIDNKREALESWAQSFSGEEISHAPLVIIVLTIMNANEHKAQQAIKWYDFYNHNTSQQDHDILPTEILNYLCEVNIKRLRGDLISSSLAAKKAFHMLSEETPTAIKAITGFYLIHSHMGIHKYNEISELFSKVSAQLQECGIISWLIKLKRSEGQFHILHTADIAQASECFSEAFSLIEKYDFKNDEDICKVEINHFMLNYYVNNTKLVTQLIENYLDNDFFHIQSQKQFLKALSIIKALIGLSRLTEAESAINYLNTCSISYPLPSSYQLFEYIQFWFDVKKKNINKILFRIKSIESKVLSEKYHLLSHESTILFHAYLTLNEKEKAANHLIRIKNSLHTVNSIFFNLHVDLMSFCYDSHYNKHQSPQEALSLLHKKSQELNLEGVFLETIRHYPMLMPTLPKEKNTPQKELPTKKALHIVDSNNFCANDIPIITEREKEVLQLINQGFSNHQIALDLKISLHTVKMHNKNIFKKLNVKNRFQAVNLALKYNIISAT